MNICIYGASSDLIDKKYISAGEELGRLMAQRGHKLVYGAGGKAGRGRQLEKSLRDIKKEIGR